jgi:hypothetical protein
MVQYRTYKSSPLVILSQNNPIRITPSCFWEINIHMYLCLRSGPCSSGFPAGSLFAFLVSPMCTTCPSHLILFDLITLILLGEKYRLWRFSTASLSNPYNRPWRSIGGCEMSRLPYYLDSQFTDGHEVVILKRRPPFTPRNIPGIHFC